MLNRPAGVGLARITVFSVSLSLHYFTTRVVRLHSSRSRSVMRDDTQFHNDAAASRPQHQSNIEANAPASQLARPHHNYPR
eukprot:9426341-Pyramimonas_sp.AAC.1